jgi:1,4-alpha-glucan branching enzyme
MPNTRERVDLSTLMRPMYSNYGVFVNQNKVTFKIPLPYINKNEFSVRVHVIAKEDQFNSAVNSNVYELHTSGEDRGLWEYIPENLWVSDAIPLVEGKEYVYRYQIEGTEHGTNNTVKSMFFGDPFTRRTSNGEFSTVKVQEETSFNWTDSNYKVHSYEDSVIYEVNVAEFNNNFKGLTEKIPYIKSLGVNVIELMPITGINENGRWGYLPVSYFSPEERFGSPEDLKEFINICHKNNIAVILDQVYAHTDFMFPYDVGYNKFFPLWYDEKNKQKEKEYAPNPIKSAYNNFANKNDFRKPFTIEFMKTINEFWINEYHVDGFRYDHVNGFLDRDYGQGNLDNWYDHNNRPTFKSLQEICNSIYSYSESIYRFQGTNNTSNIIQVVEDLNESLYQLSNISKNCTNGCWEKGLYITASEMAKSKKYIKEFCHKLLLKDRDYEGKDRWENFTGTKNIDGKSVKALPVQYIESHDESRLMYKISTGNEWNYSGYEFNFGLKDQAWWKLQPYAIALLTSVGVPMLWAGQEFAENYGIPENGMHRVRGNKPIHWSYFYVPEENRFSKTVLPLVTLYRNLIDIRNTYKALKGTHRDSKQLYEHIDNQVIAYKRWTYDGQVIITIVNFSDYDRNINLNFETSGIWKDILAEKNGQNETFTVPYSNNLDINISKNYGRILLLT